MVTCVSRYLEMDPVIDVEALAAVGRRAGLHAVGVCRAEPFHDTAAILHERKRAGLHGGMQFTYRNPDRSTDPARLLPGATALVVGALDYHRSDRPLSGETDSEQPLARVAAYARSDHYSVLRSALAEVAALLRAEGCRAVVSADENHLVDRAAAYRAGIGWWGKSANILVPGAGSMVVLGAVVTDAPIRVSDPAPADDGCGPCSRCIDGCPTGAITAPGVVDARRCLAWLLQAEGVFDPRFRVALGDRIYGCDECGDVCPPNRVRFIRTRRRCRPDIQRGSTAGSSSAVAEPSSPGFSLNTQKAPTAGASGSVSESVPESGVRVPVLDILAATDSELLQAYGRWYIPRRQPRYLRRNALVVLGNVGDPGQPRVRAAVDRALSDPDPLIAAHAVWCARRLGLCLSRLILSDHPMVVSELERDVPLRSDVHAERRSAAERCAATRCPMIRHLLVTNDFPPKTGGIQNFLWELWSRLPPDEVVVYTTPHENAAAFDAAAPMRVIRSREPWFLPLPRLVKQVDSLAARYDVDLVVIDPALPAGLIGPRLTSAYAIIAHGAEAVLPSRIPGTSGLLRRVLLGATGVIANSGYTAAECERTAGVSLPIHLIPPGVDIDRLTPPDSAARSAARKRLGLAENAPVVASVSRLVPRKGMSTLIAASTILASEHDGLQVVIAGDGREKQRLSRLINRLNAPVLMLSDLPDSGIADVYNCADVFAMLCRSRWMGLEQEGFGIVFLEAAAAGVPQVAGDSGGVRDAVAHGETGIVLEEPTAEAAAEAISVLLRDDDRRLAMGAEARRRVVADFSCDVLAARLRAALGELAG